MWLLYAFHYAFHSQLALLPHHYAHFLRIHEFYNINQAEIDDSGKVYRWNIMAILFISQYKLTYRARVGPIKDEIVPCFP